MILAVVDARMHERQVDTSVELVRHLVASQFPEWAELPVRRVAESGTDHALYRLGRDLLVRLPIIDWAAEQGANDLRWLPVLAPHLPLTVPTPVALGQPGCGYPWRWSVVPWIEGHTPAKQNLDTDAAAVQLAHFIRALHSVDPTGGPVQTGTARGVPLANLDSSIRSLIDELADHIDADSVSRIWQESVNAPAWQGPPVWIHGDLQPGNLIVRDGRLAAVIDFGALGIGDPAADLAPAWNTFDGNSSTTFRLVLGYDDATEARAKGWVLAPALQGLRYYERSRPDLVTAARQRIVNLQSNKS